MRHSLEKTGIVKEENLNELKRILLEDQQNQGDEGSVNKAIVLLDRNLNEFLKTYFNNNS